MSWRDRFAPVRMERVALVATEEDLRGMLAAVASAGTVDLDLTAAIGTRVGIPGEDEYERAVASAIPSPPLAGHVGWVPAPEIPALANRLAPVGGAVVPLRRPAGAQPPTLMAAPRTTRGVARVLVDTYGTVPYSDVDPAWLAVVSYVVMFGMMFGDLGQGAVLLIVGVLLGTGAIPRLRRLRRMAGFVCAAGATAMFFGVLYGEFFGPTGVIPVIWLSPLDQPVTLLIAGMVVGSVLLALAYAVGTVNRVREGGWGYALYARTGIAGSLLFVAAALLVLGLVTGSTPIVVTAVVFAVAALGLIVVGLLAEIGASWSGLLQVGVELVDTVIRLTSNVVSFARLAAFGLTHAAMLAIVWSATTALWAPGWRAIAAVLVFLVGNAITFALEGLIAGIQALRLEYYELFSRIFLEEGRPFLPWTPHLPDEYASAVTAVPAEEEGT
jgi:V/A-type H+-transporting ATPase subunit I